MRTVAEVLGAAPPVCSLPKQVGDHVRIGPNLGPGFVVIYVSGDLAWVRPLANGEEGLVPVTRLFVQDI